MIMPSITDLLQEAREAGWTDEALAERLSVSRATISRWRGGRLPESPPLVQLALRSLLADEEAPERGTAGRPISPRSRAVSLAVSLGARDVRPEDLARLRSGDDFLGVRFLEACDIESTPEWETIARGLARMTTHGNTRRKRIAHNPRNPLGRILYLGSHVERPEIERRDPLYREMQFLQLLSGRDLGLHTLERLFHVLAREQVQVDVRQIASLVFDQDQDPIRLQVTRDYFRAPDWAARVAEKPAESADACENEELAC